MVAIVCIDCGVTANRATKTAKRCMPCAEIRDREVTRQSIQRRKDGIAPKRHKSPGERWKNFAAHGVAFGKAIGLLPALDGSIPCVDCGRPAECYDHRDYSRPLDVAAVCSTCNARRGPASVPDIPEVRRHAA